MLVPISEKAIKEIRPYIDDRRSLDIKRGQREYFVSESPGDTTHQSNDLLYYQEGL